MNAGLRSLEVRLIQSGLKSFLLFFSVGFCLSAPAQVPQKKAKNEASYPMFQTGVELGGAGLVYSLFGSARPVQRAALNLGVAFWGFDNVVVPTSVSILIGESNSLLEVLGGAAISISNDTSALGEKFMHTNFTPELGIGYRYWPQEGGLHFRAILYILFLGEVGDRAGSLTIPFPGISAGYAF